MSNDRKGTEVYVGLFLLIGFAVIAVMFIKFGRLGQGLTSFYEITVEFPNASGLAKNADVLLSGARIGSVLGGPKLVKDAFSVDVRMQIQDDVKIPKDSTIIVNQSGLLGDCYIEVLPPDRFDPSNMIQPGDHIKGSSKPGLEALQQKGGIVLDKLTTELDEIKSLTVNINQNLMSEQNLKNLRETFDHLNTMSANLTESSKKLDGILAKGDTAVDSAKKTLETADKAAADLRTAMADFKKLAESAGKALDSAKGMVDTGNRVLKKAEHGEGAIGVLLGDKETAANLKSFVGNLKRSGPIFYKDRPAPATPTPTLRTR
jgi:phospholipid/cholesterol/gamma-HCH transport system substrate-binding protein